MPKLYLEPFFRGEDKADGGIRRVVDAQRKHLPGFGFSVVDTMDAADIVATHAVTQLPVPVGKPWVYHNHGMYYREFGWDASWYSKANRIMADIVREADYLTAPSAWVAQSLRRGTWATPTVLYHGVDVAEWQGGTPGNYILWNKARADKASDPKPVSLLAERNPQWNFVSTFGYQHPNMRLLGAVPYEEMRDAVKSAGIYLVTAKETFGIGTLEAMAAGVPVVGWAYGGQAEIITQGETGWLVPEGDYAGLEEGIRWALANRTRIAEAARTDVALRWTWERAIARYAALYEQAVLEAWTPRPKVSVVVPCYNLGRFIGKTLESVQNQTLQDWECIVVDDASTDDSEAVAKPYLTDKRFRYLRNEHNLRVSNARNRGLREARGGYLACLDADDWLAPDALQVLSSALDADRSVGIAYGKLTLFHEDGRELGPGQWPGTFNFTDQIQGRNQVPTFCMFRRSLVERTGGYRARNNPIEDADLWARASSIGYKPVLVTERSVLNYRVRRQSLSRSMPARDWSAWYPWGRRPEAVPFAAAVTLPADKALPVYAHDDPLISVVIPVGPGHEDLLLDAIDSVQAQTLTQWECIVVNDTGKPLPWVPSWVRVIETEGSTGPAHARNAGIAAARADLFVPLDADDFLQADALEQFYGMYKQAEGVVYSQWYDDKGAQTTVYDPAYYDASLLIKKGCLHAVTALYPKAAWETVGGFDETLSHWEDWDFQLKLAQKGICSTKLALPLWTYRKHTGLRRESNLAAFEQGKKAILAKWSRYWDGQEELMACSSCPSGNRPPAPPNNSAEVLNGDVELLEYTVASAGARTYRGQSTGTMYRFGAPSGRQKYVYKDDVAGLLALRNQFRQVTVATPVQASPQMEAAITQPPVPEPQPEPEPTPDPTPEPTPAPTGDGRLPMEPFFTLRALVPSLSEEQLRVALAAEKASENPRQGVLNLLEKALELEPVAV